MLTLLRGRALVAALIMATALAVCPPARAQQQNDAKSPLREFADFVLASLPAELAADLIIQVSDSPASAREGRNWQIELYERALELASSALTPVKLVPVPGGTTDSRAEIAAEPYRLGIDRLSLKTRAVRGLLRFRPARALELGTQLDHAVAPLTCQDILVPDPSAFWQLAPAMLMAWPKSPSSAGASDDRAMWLEQHVASITSSTELGPAVQAVMSSSLPETDVRRLIVTVSSVLRTLDDDDRSFSAPFWTTEVVIARLVDTVGDDQLATFLLESFRMYLVRHLKGVRCEPAVDPGREASLLKSVNEIFVRHRIAPLTQAERTPSRVVLGRMNIEFWQSPAAKDILEREKVLRFDGRRTRLDAEKRTPEWTDMLGDFYKALDSWKRSASVTEGDYRQQRFLAHQSILSVVPPGPEWDRALSQLILFLRSEGMQHFGMLEWASKVHTLIFRTGRSGHREQVLRALRESGDPVMGAYADAEDLLKASR
jgi:hypothetical protein